MKRDYKHWSLQEVKEIIKEKQGASWDELGKQYNMQGQRLKRVALRTQKMLKDNETGQPHS